MATVYCVFTGEYSDYELDSIWDTPEGADARAAQLKDLGEYCVQREDVTVNAGPPRRVRYECYLYGDGDLVCEGPPFSIGAVLVRNFKDWRWVVSEAYEDEASAPTTRYEVVAPTSYSPWPSLKVWCEAENKQHALKIASEIRAQLVADNKVPAGRPV